MREKGYLKGILHGIYVAVLGWMFADLPEARMVILIVVMATFIYIALFVALVAREEIEDYDRDKNRITFPDSEYAVQPDINPNHTPIILEKKTVLLLKKDGKEIR